MLFGAGYVIAITMLLLIASFTYVMIKQKHEWIIAACVGFLFVVITPIAATISYNGSIVPDEYQYFKNDIYLKDTQYFVVFKEYERGENCVVIKAPYYETHNYLWEFAYTIQDKDLIIDVPYYKNFPVSLRNPIKQNQIVDSCKSK